MTEIGYANLSTIAASLGKSLRSTNLVLPTLSSSIDKIVRFTLDGRRVDWGSNGEVYYIEVAASSQIVASIGTAEPDLLLTDVPVESVGSRLVFARSDSRFAPDDWLRGGGVKLLEELRIENGESVLISRDRIAALTYPRTVELDWERVRALVRIAESLTVTDTTVDRSSIGGLPPEFMHFGPLAAAWAIPDDRERSEALRVADSASLKALVAAVIPEIERVNRYLDANPQSEAATKLSALVQAALEARQQLGTGSEPQ